VERALSTGPGLPASVKGKVGAVALGVKGGRRLLHGQTVESSRLFHLKQADELVLLAPGA
jgi:hypothetical protein